MVPTNPKIIATSGGAARPMPKSILQGWKQRKENCVPIPSSA